MNRRGFIAFLMAAPVTRALPWAQIAKVLPAPIGLTMQEIIEETIKRRTPEIIKNIEANNQLLAHLSKKSTGRK